MSTTYTQRVAARIRELRTAGGLSLRELARRSGLVPESVSRSERGLTEITITNLAKLCMGLGMDLPSFFEFARRPARTASEPSDLRRAIGLVVTLSHSSLRVAIDRLERLHDAGSPKRSATSLVRGPLRKGKRMA